MSSTEGAISGMATTVWRKSSFSSGGNSDCVEVAFGQVSVAVRDSKNPTGPVLSLPEADWRAAVTRLPG
ncbi:MAG: DUF397 domain-containing protein [Actinophytocola sp.]|nr:DUF397 domain-containing protein [Actinophytocola sp.]